jgi:hypothetical protein
MFFAFFSQSHSVFFRWLITLWFTQARTQALIAKLSAVRADYEALVQRMVRMDRRKLHVVFVVRKCTAEQAISCACAV